MRNYTLILLAMVLFTHFSVGDSFCQGVAWDLISRENRKVTVALIHPEDPNIIYMGADNAVLKTNDAGVSWNRILLIKGENRTVNFLLFDRGNNDSLYAATGNGLYYSSNREKNWKRIFKGKNYLENECTTLAVLPYRIYLGTKSGLFSSQDKGRSWHREAGKLGNSHILAIANDPKGIGCIYVICAAGVFKSSDQSKNWERLFSAPSPEGEYLEEQGENDTEENGQVVVRYISIDPNNLNHIYIATSSGVYKSQDKGQSWQLVTDFGLLNRDVIFLLISDRSELYAVTKSGIFEYVQQRWHELSFNLSANRIKTLSLDKQGNLYASCDEGLFKTKPRYFATNYNDNEENNTISFYYKDEPKIDDVQRQAIKYAEVEPEKIARWRKQAARRAWLPKITIDMDRDRNRTISKSIWGIYSSYSNGNETAPGRYYIGPDDETRYNNENWGVSLTWELGDLIWNDDQTSIDVRSRLMVQLRDDILDEVTKYYFERIRLKMELDNIPANERRKRTEKELRLQELTAQLDALTGGYFSKNIAK